MLIKPYSQATATPKVSAAIQASDCGMGLLHPLSNRQASTKIVVQSPVKRSFALGSAELAA